MVEGTVRKPTPVVGDYPGAPLWIRYILGNVAVYGDFYTDITQGIHNCNEKIADFLSKDDLTAANRMLGKREALAEIRFQVETYRKLAMEEEER